MAVLYRFTLIVTLAALLLSACGGGTQSPGGSSSSAPGITIEITGEVCPGVEVAAGDQVTWSNQDTRARLVRVETSAGEVLFEAGDLQPGDSASFTFTEVGEFSYVCSPNETIAGTIRVQP